MSDVPYEIERKFLCAPDRDALDAAATSVSRIEQTYLVDPQGGAERVRRRTVRDTDGERVELTHTRKVAVSAGVVEEYERDVDEVGYADLLSRRDPDRVTVVKTRWVVPYAGRTLEIDHLEAPRDLWLLEVELSDTTDLHAALDLPDWVGTTREVTGDDRYTNRMLALPDDAPPR